MESDGDLLQRYLSGADQAFTALVQRHLNLVYRTALRRVGHNPHAADDVTQRVFTSLAQKASTLTNHPSLVGWLYTGTRFAAAEMVRSEQRRRVHEMEAHSMNDLDRLETATAIEGVLDDVLGTLVDRDREMVLLHFFEGRSFVAVAADTGSTPDAVRMRVNRALEKLRVELGRRGVASTSAALALTLGAQSGVAATLPSAAVLSQHALHAAALAQSGTVGAMAKTLPAFKPAVTWTVAGMLAVGSIVVFASRWGDRSDVPSPVLTPPVAEASVTSAAAGSTGPAMVRSEPVGAPANLLARGSASEVRRVTLQDLSPAERNLLALLWQLQERHQEQSQTAVGIGRNAPNSEGIDALAARKFVAEETAELSGRRRVHLTAAGIQFCTTFREEFDGMVPVSNSAKPR